MPPPRFVRRSSTSSLRSVSIFSAKAGVASAAGVAVGAAATTAGEGETSGVAEALVTAGGGAVDDNAAGAGRRGVCLAIHHSHATNPMTQSITAIHAVRSIKLFVSQNHAQRSVSATGSRPQPPQG